MRTLLAVGLFLLPFSIILLFRIFNSVLSISIFPFPHPGSDPFSKIKTYNWSSKYEDWQSRCILHQTPHDIDFTKAEPVLASYTSADMGEDFCMALLTLEGNRSSVVDSAGNVLTLSTEDAIGFHNLTSEALDMSSTGYVIDYPLSCQPNQIARIMGLEGSYKDFEVYAYDKSLRDLKGEPGQLPGVIWELFGLIEETCFSDEGNRDGHTLQLVKQLFSPFLHGVI